MRSITNKRLLDDFKHLEYVCHTRSNSTSYKTKSSDMFIRYIYTIVSLLFTLLRAIRHPNIDFDSSDRDRAQRGLCIFISAHSKCKPMSFILFIFINISIDEKPIISCFLSLAVLLKKSASRRLSSNVDPLFTVFTQQEHIYKVMWWKDLCCYSTAVYWLIVRSKQWDRLDIKWTRCLLCWWDVFYLKNTKGHFSVSQTRHICFYMSFSKHNGCWSIWLELKHNGLWF